MSITVTISSQQLSATVKEMLSTDQWALLEQILAEVEPRVTARALDWIGQNGCGYYGSDKLAARTAELNAIAEFIARCYERFPANHPEGAAIRAAIHTAVTENDQKDHQ